MNRAASEIIHDIDSRRDSLLRSLRNLTQEQYDFKPDSNSWSIGEVVHHLYLTEAQISTLLDRMLEKARKRTTPPANPELPSQLQSLDGFTLDVPVTPAKSPESSVPTHGLPKVDLLHNLSKSREGLKSIASGLCEYDLSNIRFPHPELEKINLYQWLLIVGKHEQRHTIQIEAIKLRNA